MAHTPPHGAPSSASKPVFVFGTCSPASSAWLKRDAARYHPDLRLAFSGPGLVTWKAPDLRDAFQLLSPLATSSGFGVGRAGTFAELEVLCGDVHRRLCSGGGSVWLHVFTPPRDIDAPLALGDAEAAQRTTVEARLRSAMPFEGATQVPAAGSLVIDVIVLGGEPESYFVGWHRQRSDRPGTPGGVAPRLVNPSAPSRAYSKTWELLALGELTVGKNARVIELGAAPGGGTFAWLEQGASVLAIDPAEMSPSVEQLSREVGADYQHLRLTAGEVEAGQLPRAPEFLYSDVNLAPAVSLKYVERLCALVGPPKEAVLMNLKVNDSKVEEALPKLLKRVSEMGKRLRLPELRAAQLPSHRKEIGIVLRRRRSASPNKTPNPR